ncbi:melanoma-associated antigen B2-like [Octodon degus]|uniref:Melanoma-associated antigen B2-like n=1 Tax=Octodon degus TaxID=10160 RepID=A0A6P3FHI0_OCTDE|nr:melanoma-associated antigen B2-like [Octodon degus]
MPRGHKSKLRARAKRDQARGHRQAVQDAQETAAKEDSPSCSSPIAAGDAAAGDAAGLPQESPGVPPTSTGAAASAPASVSSKRSDKGPKKRGQAKEAAASSNVRPYGAILTKDILVKKADVVMKYLMYKYKMKEPILKWEMLKIIHKRFREQFPEIIQIASGRMELIFGLELKELNPGSGSYSLTTVLDLPTDKSQANDFPRTGLIMSLLGIIFLHDYSAPEKDVWEFLSMFGITDKKKHFIFGDVRKLITKDLVQEKYVEYNQVPGSDPACYQFQWGPRAYAETSKMKVLEFLAKVTCSEVRDYPCCYAEALKDEKERAQAKSAAMSEAKAQARPRSKASSSLSTT